MPSAAAAAASSAATQSSRSPPARGVAVHRHEKVRPRLVGDARALVERDVAVVLAGEDHGEAEGAKAPGERPRDGERDVLLAEPARPDGAGVAAAMPRIDHHPPHLE